jgi:soluble lytic murein transglycosylase
VGILLRTKGLLLLLGTAILLGLAGWWLLHRLYPYPYRGLIERAAARHQVDPYLVAALIRNESKFNPSARSAAGAVGLMQLMPETAAWIATQRNQPFHVADLTDPAVNIEMGCWYLANLQRAFGGDRTVVLAAYNAGRNNVAEWLNSQTWTGERHTLSQIPFPETRTYVARVLRDETIYRHLYQRE